MKMVSYTIENNNVVIFKKGSDNNEYLVRSCAPKR